LLISTVDRRSNGWDEKYCSDFFSALQRCPFSGIDGNYIFWREKKIGRVFFIGSVRSEINRPDFLIFSTWCVLGIDGRINLARETKKWEKGFFLLCPLHPPSCLPVKQRKLTRQWVIWSSAVNGSVSLSLSLSLSEI
jgi:hypothetical protein